MTKIHIASVNSQAWNWNENIPLIRMTFWSFYMYSKSMRLISGNRSMAFKCIHCIVLIPFICFAHFCLIFHWRCIFVTFSRCMDSPNTDVRFERHQNTHFEMSWQCPQRDVWKNKTCCEHFCFEKEYFIHMKFFDLIL